MTYRHGVYVTEQATSIVPPRRVSAALPVVFGTAPVHRATSGSQPVNEPVLCYTYKEAVETLGWSDDWAGYTLCEFIKGYFALYNVAPIVAVNVFDPATHKQTATDEAKTFANDEITLDHGDLVADPTVTTADGNTTYVKDTDYTVDRITGKITRLAAGSIAADAQVLVDYDYAAPSQVDSDDIVGGIDSGTGKATGLELVDSVFPMYRLVPGEIVAPGWSNNPAVAAVMAAKAANINGLFKALALTDIPDTTVTKYSDAPSYKNENNLTDEQMLVCWPKVKLGTETYHMSTQLAGLLAQVDADHEDIPYKSASNENFQMDAATADGKEVWLGPEQANYLNGNGIVTALNFVGGWKCWGNRTGAYPGVTDVKDTFGPIRRMFNWIGNTLVLTFWQKIDHPANRRLIETVVDSANIWLNSLAAREFILGGRVEFQRDENAVTDVMDGIIKFHVYITPPSPAREIVFIQEYDPAYIKTLF